MKKVKSFIFLIIIALSFNACGSGGGDSDNTNNDTKSVSVYFSNSLSTEESTIQPYYDWYLSKNKEQSKLNEIYANGGSIKKIIKLNAVASDKQFWIITEKNE